MGTNEKQRVFLFLAECKDGPTHITKTYITTTDIQKAIRMHKDYHGRDPDTIKDMTAEHDEGILIDVALLNLKDK